MTEWRYTLALASALCLLTTHARADDPDKRETPDYDGREEETTAGEVLLWVPRVVLSPLYLVSEYVVRRPLGFLVSEAERANVPELLYNLFTWGPDHSIGLIPVAFIEFGFDPSVGLYFFWNDALVRHHDLRMSASTWGQEWLAARLIDRLQLVGISDDTELSLQAAAVRRPDYLFHGLGPRTFERDRTRYGADTLEAMVRFDHGFFRASRFAATFGTRAVTFREGGYDDDAVLTREIAAGVRATPAAFDTGYTLLYSRVELAIDSRLDGPAPSSGVRVEGHVQHNADVRDPRASGFVRYGGAVGGFLDLNDHGRVVSLSVTTLFVDPLGSSSIPFRELAAVGGENSMRGFRPDRLLDRSAAFTTLRYRWPIWVVLDGSVQLAVGNVFGEHLKGIRPELMRLSAAVGIESVGSPDSSFELLVGFGSETFDDGAAITSVRITAGAAHGF